MCDDEEVAALVVDNGSGMCKVSTNGTKQLNNLVQIQLRKQVDEITSMIKLARIVIWLNKSQASGEEPRRSGLN